jgi:hypothetical protein
VASLVLSHRCGPRMEGPGHVPMSPMSPMSPTVSGGAGCRTGVGEMGFRRDMFGFGTIGWRENLCGSAPLWVAGGGPSGSGSVKYTMANAMRKSISLRQVIVADSQSRGHQIETVVQQIKGEGHLSTARAWSPVLFPPWTGHTVPSKPIRTGFIYSITIMSRQKCVTHSCNGPSLFVRHVEFDATRHHHDSREAGGSSVAHPET